MENQHPKLGRHSYRPIQKLDAHMVRARAMASVTRKEMRATISFLCFLFNGRPIDRVN